MPSLNLRWYVRYGSSWAAFQKKDHAIAFFKRRQQFKLKCEIWDSVNKVRIDA